jgi:CubicO group peptidase (beta-lactamase class C family)
MQVERISERRAPMSVKAAHLATAWMILLGLNPAFAWAGDDAVPGAVPVFSESGPDAAAYGAEQGYPIGLPLKQQQNMVGNYSNVDRLYATRAVAAAAQPSPLARAPQEIDVTYTFGGETRALRDYLAHNPTTGLLIARDDAILFEHYQYGRTDRNRFYSQSMAKTVTSMLIGIAIAEDAIHSVDDTAQTYVPGLVGTELGRTPIRALLHMASGIAFTQGDYAGGDDDARLSHAVLGRDGLDPVAAVSQFNTRVAPPDTLWHYANLNPEVLALVLTRATHMTMAEYLQTRVWQPMGAEAEARWQVDLTGGQPGYCCFNATLRDYARFALVLAHDGAWNDRQIIPRPWLLDATAPVAEGSYLAVDPGARPWGYGYQVWLMPGPRRTFVLEGVEGQRIFVDPAAHLVLVHTAVRLKPTHDPGELELIALWRSLLAQSEGN